MSSLKTTNILHPSSSSNNIVLDSSGNFAVQAGTAAAPAIQATGDSNTGIYFPAADTVAISTGGSERIRCDSSGTYYVGATNVNSNLAGGAGGSNDLVGTRNLVGVFANSGVPTLLVWNTSAGVVSGKSARLAIGGQGNSIARSVEISCINDAEYRNNMVFATNGDPGPSEVARLTHDKYFRMAASTGGIQFNGDTAAANALDDYEEGTWTPELADATSGGNLVTHSVQNGLYTKVGNVVTAYFRVTWTSKGSASGNVNLRGFPFSARTNTGNYYYPGAIVPGSGQTTVSIEGGQSRGGFWDATGGYAQFSELAASDTGLGLNGVVTYLVP